MIDTVRVLVDVKTPPLEQLKNRNVHVHGRKCVVSGRFGVKAHIFRPGEGSQLIIEASIPKFITGQNLVGSEFILIGCNDMILEILDRAGIKITRDESRAIFDGRYQLKRVDFAVHADARTAERAEAAMRGLRALCISGADECSFYGNETLYIGQHSTRRTLRVYRKDLELLKKPMPKEVVGRKQLMKNAEALIRFELTLRAPELKRLGLSDPTRWSPAIAHELIQPWLDTLCHAGGVVPSIDGINTLSKSMQAKLRAFVYGDATAFSLSPSTLADCRRKVRAATGIDIGNPLTLEQQRDAMTTVQEVLAEGIQFQDRTDQWLGLRPVDGK